MKHSDPLMICHAGHQKSGSHSVMLEILGHHSIQIYFDQQGSKEEILNKLRQRPRLVVAWQADWWTWLAQAQGHAVVIVPMWDSARERPDIYYRGMRDVKSLCFSRRLFNILSALGLEARHAQYAPDPASLPKVTTSTGKPALFLWERLRDEMDRLGATQLLQNWPVGKIRVRAGDCVGKPGDSPREKYLRELARHQIYIAPRRFEGIGLSFLEAMAMGLCVVAEDQPTANEYILPGVSGFLFRGDRDGLWPLPRRSEAQILQAGMQARKSMVKIRQKWVLQIPEIRHWLSSHGSGRFSPNLTRNELRKLEEKTALFSNQPEPLYQWIYERLKTRARSPRSAAGAARQRSKVQAGEVSGLWRRPRKFFLHHLMPRTVWAQGGILGNEASS